MANIGKRAPSVGALVYKSTPRKHAEELKKFNGRWTKQTHEAAARMAAKPIEEAIPAPVMRKLWRLTGGWSGDWDLRPPPLPKKTRAVYFVIKVSSELTLYVTDLAQAVWLEWRGQVVAYRLHKWNDGVQLRKFQETGERHAPPPPPPPPPVPWWVPIVRPFLNALDKLTGKSRREEKRRKRQLEQQQFEILKGLDKLKKHTCELFDHERKLREKMEHVEKDLAHHQQLLNTLAQGGSAATDLMKQITKEQQMLAKLQNEVHHMSEERECLLMEQDKLKSQQKEMELAKKKIESDQRLKEMQSAVMFLTQQPDRGRASSIMMQGPPGTGKTSIVDAFTSDKLKKKLMKVEVEKHELQKHLHEMMSMSDNLRNGNGSMEEIRHCSKNIDELQHLLNELECKTQVLHNEFDHERREREREDWELQREHDWFVSRPEPRYTPPEPDWSSNYSSSDSSSYSSSSDYGSSSSSCGGGGSSCGGGDY